MLGNLRKALFDLEKMGAIKIRAQSGAYVQKFSHKKVPSKVLPVDFDGVSLNDIIVARRAIELASIEIASERNSAHWILKEMRKLVLVKFAMKMDMRLSS